MRVLLASTSARRRELLLQIGIESLSVDHQVIEEAPLADELARNYARRMARMKCAGAYAVTQGSSSFVHSGEDFFLAADTIVSVGRRILGQPKTMAEAERFLYLLSGRSHRVHTAVVVRARGGVIAERVVMTRVTFRRLARSELLWFLDQDAWRGYAGGYALQGYAGCFVRNLSGSYSNVVGLPLMETQHLLHGLGYRRQRFLRSSLKA